VQVIIAEKSSQEKKGQINKSKSS